MVSCDGGGTNIFTKIHSTVSPLIMLKFSVGTSNVPLIRQSDDIKFQFNGTVSITPNEPACTDNGVVMLLFEVSGIVSAVEFAGFVALNMVKLKEPSPFVVSLVIFIVGGSAASAFGIIVINPTLNETRIINANL